MDAERESKLKKDIVEMYFVSKEMLLYRDEIDELQQVDPQFYNEMKMVLEHFMRVLAVDFKIKEETEDYYVEDNLKSCFNHIYRAGYDSLDWVSMTLRAKMCNEIKNFSNKAIVSVIPEYYKEIKPSVEDLNAKIAGFRSKKDVGHKDTSCFMEYAETVKILREHYINIIKKKSALVEYDKKLKKEKRWNSAKEAGIAILCAIVGGLGLFLFQHFFN